MIIRLSRVLLIIMVALIFNIFPLEVYALGETVLSPNVELKKRLSTELRSQSYVIRIDKSGYQNFKFIYLENSTNQIGDGFQIEIKDKDKRIIHTVTDIKSEYSSPNFGFKKGEEVFIYINEKFDYIDPVNGIDIRFQFNTIENKFFEAEDNNSIENSKTLTGNIGLRGNLYSAGDEDWMYFKVPPFGESSFKLEFPNANLELLKAGYSVEFFDIDKNLLKRLDNIINVVPITDVSYKKGQSLYIRIFATDSDKAPDKVDYLFTAVTSKVRNGEKEVNDTFKKANPISKTKIAFLTDEFDVDWFAFQSKKTKKHKISLKTGNLENKSYTINLYKKGKKSKLTKKAHKKISNDKTISFSLKKGEKLWIEVRGTKKKAPVGKEYIINIK